MLPWKLVIASKDIQHIIKESTTNMQIILITTIILFIIALLNLYSYTYKDNYDFYSPFRIHILYHYSDDHDYIDSYHFKSYTSYSYIYNDPFSPHHQRFHMLSSTKNFYSSSPIQFAACWPINKFYKRNWAFKHEINKNRTQYHVIQSQNVSIVIKIE